MTYNGVDVERYVDELSPFIRKTIHLPLELSSHAGKVVENVMDVFSSIGLAYTELKNPQNNFIHAFSPFINYPSGRYERASFQPIDQCILYGSLITQDYPNVYKKMLRSMGFENLPHSTDEIIERIMDISISKKDIKEDIENALVGIEEFANTTLKLGEETGRSLTPAMDFYNVWTSVFKEASGIDDNEMIIGLSKDVKGLKEKEKHLLS